MTYMWNLKNKTNEPLDKTGESQTQKTNLWLPKGKEKGRISQDYGINRYTLLHIKQISNKDLLYNTGNNIQYLVITYNGKYSEKNTSELLCCLPKLNTAL